MAAEAAANPILNPIAAFYAQSCRREMRGRPALWCRGETRSYGELAADARRVAAWIRSVTPAAPAETPRVGVLGGRSLAAVTAVLGAGFAGATYVPLLASHPPARLGALLERAELDALIVDAAGQAVLDANEVGGAPAHRLDLEGADALAAFAPLEGPPPSYAPDALAYLMFTSGTTGVPKGVMVMASNVDRFLSAMRERFEIREGDRCSQFFDLTFDLSVFDLFIGLGAGATLFMLTEKDRLAPCRFIDEHQLDVWFSVPSSAALARRTRQLRPASLSSLRLSLFCGEPLPAGLAETWREAAPGCELENLYGPTEATVACLGMPCSERIVETPERGSVAIGRPFADTQVAVVDPDRKFLKDGEMGELVVSGPLLAAGYWRDPERTTDRYPTLFHPTLGSTRWYLTGDLAYRDEDGDYHHLGRVDNQVKVMGHRIELEDCDAHLRQVCGSDLAGAVPWPMRDGSAEGLVAFVSGTSLSAAEIQQAMRARVPAPMVPRRVVVLDELPLTPNGKMDRRAMLALLAGESPT